MAEDPDDERQGIASCVMAGRAMLGLARDESEEPRLRSLLTALATSAAPAAPILRHLRMRDTGSLLAASRALRAYCVAPTGRMVVPTFNYRQHRVEKVDLTSIEVMYADDAGIINIENNTAFASCLAECNSLQCLYCSHNSKLIVAICASGLGKLGELSVLDLSHNRLAVDDHRNFEREQPVGPLIAALPPRLRFLDLSYNLLHDEHVFLLVDGLEASCSSGTPPVLEQLLLRSNYLGNGAGFALASFMKSASGACLSRLDLRTNRIEADGACQMLSALQSHPNMREMRVGYNRQNKQQDLQTAGLASVLLRKALAANAKTKLEFLDLNNVRIGDSGIRQLSHSLALNNVLRRLDIAFNSIGPEGAEALGHALEANDHLREVDLRDNDIGDDGAVSLARGLGSNNSLRKIQVARNGISSRGVLALLGAVKARDQLNIDFGASGAGSLNHLQVRSMMGRTQSMANLTLIREVERGSMAGSGDGQMSMMFAC